RPGAGAGHGFCPYRAGHHEQVVGSPAYLARRKPPRTPDDLTDMCASICARRRTVDSYEWEFIKGKRAWNVAVDGQLVFNNAYDIFEAAKAGFGLAYLPEDMVRPCNRERATRLVTGGVVSDMVRVAPLFSKSPPAIAGNDTAGRCVAPSFLTRARGRSLRPAGIRESGLPAPGSRLCESWDPT
ncbi:LysR substrate-binding domain-containing protein, partial [Burkholderia multivorans]|uniref:LysR substrate-binding domain-containing protein n=1 Tax=Burkholderia multivorans TaxID=87883 RepID=UPI00207C5E71